MRFGIGELVVAGLLGFILGGLIGLVLIDRVMKSSVEMIKEIDQELVARGYKYYDAKTGELKWKDQCDGKQASD